MDAQTPHFNFGGGVGTGGFLPVPVSAFSAYSLLRRCNYFISPPADVAEKPVQVQRISPDYPIIGPIDDVSRIDNEKRFLDLPSSILPSTPLFSYPHHLQVLQHKHLVDATNTSTTPCSSLYSANFRRQRGEKKAIPDELKDDKYFERRRRNNQAAKKSRDARKMREDEVALRATILEHENAILRAQVLTLREETSSLRQMLLQKKAMEIATRDTQICGS